MPDTMTQAVEIDFTATATPTPLVPAPAPALPANLAPEAATIFQIIERAARDPSVDIDKMERLISMQERVQGRQAQVEFDNAMADAQEAMKPIRANLENKQTSSEYADYAALDRAIRPIYSKHGFSLSFTTGDGAPDNCVRVICTVAHRSGHRERPHLDMPADGKGARGGDVMTRTHATGAAITYGKRYLLGMIFNLAVTRDDDGNGASADWTDEAERDGLLRDGERRSTYNVERARRAQEWADDAIQNLNLSANAEAAKDWRRESQTVPPGKKKSPLQWLEDNSPGQYHRVKMAYENVTGEELA